MLCVKYVLDSVTDIKQSAGEEMAGVGRMMVVVIVMLN